MQGAVLKHKMCRGVSELIQENLTNTNCGHLTGLHPSINVMGVLPLQEGNDNMYK